MTSEAVPTNVSPFARARALLFDEDNGAVLWPLLIDRTAVALARSRRDATLVAVFALDDPRAASGAPIELSELRARLASLLRPDDTIGWVAGRSFVVVCNEIREDQDAVLIAQRLMHNAGMVAQLGITLGTTHDDAETLVRRALEEARRGLSRIARSETNSASRDSA